MAITPLADVTEIVNSEYIDPLIRDYAMDANVAAQFCRIGDLRGKATKVWSVPIWVKDAAAAVAETDSLSSEVLETTEVSITCGEFGIRRDPTKTAIRTTIVDLESYMTEEAGRLCMEQIEDDIVAEFANASTSRGTTTVDATLADFVSCIAALNAALAQGEKVFIGHPVQTGDLLAAVASSSASIFTGGANQSLVDGQRGQMGYAGTLLNVDLYHSSLCDTANAAADRVGAMFINGNASNGGNPRHAAYGLAVLWMPELERNTDVGARTTLLVTTCSTSAAELSDFASVKLVTDA